MFFIVISTNLSFYSPAAEIFVASMKVSCSAPAGAPTAADRIRNPGYRPTYSYGLAHPISKNSLMQAWLILGCRLGLS